MRNRKTFCKSGPRLISWLKCWSRSERFGLVQHHWRCLFSSSHSSSRLVLYTRDNGLAWIRAFLVSKSPWPAVGTHRVPVWTGTGLCFRAMSIFLPSVTLGSSRRLRLQQPAAVRRHRWQIPLGRCMADVRYKTMRDPLFYFYREKCNKYLGKVYS